MKFITLLALLMWTPNVVAQQSASRPNIIVFMVDDYDKYETSVYGDRSNPTALTPNLDRLAREGLTFNNAFVTSTVCTPSRYTFLTGRYASSSYSDEFLSQFPHQTQPLPGFNVALEPDNMNVGAILAKHGYATGFVGKYHVGPDDKSPEAAQALGLHYVQKNVPYTDELNRKMYENEKLHRALIKQRGFTWAKNIYWQNTKAPFQQHNPEWTIAAALDFVDEHKDQPFYLHYATTLLHGPNGSWHTALDYPLVTGEGMIGKPLNILPRDTVMPRIEAAGLTKDQAGYLWMDDSLGLLLDKLDALGIADNTLVLFVADHGSNNKGSLYKSRSAEVPCIIRWANGIKPGVRTNELIQNTDFVPTWFELAGVTPPGGYKIDGRSIAPLFANPHTAIRDHVYAEMGAARSIKTKTHSYIALRLTQDQIDEAANDSRGIKTITGLSGGVSRAAGSHPYAYDNDQLYDLMSDPDSQSNLATDPAQASTLKRLQQKLRQELATFPNHTFGEFVPGPNTSPPGHYGKLLKTLHQAATAPKVKAPKAPKNTTPRRKRNDSK